MANQTISVNRRKYAVGLMWQPVAAGYTARAYARSLAHAVDGRLRLFVGFNNMVGLAPRRHGLRSGLPVAAAEVMSTMGEYSSVLAAFITSRGFFWVVAIRNGVIISDNLFEREADARKHYFQLAQIPEWGAFVAPNAWGAARAVEKNIADVIHGASQSTLRSISRARAIVFSALMMLAFFAGMFVLFREPINDVLSPRRQISKIDPELAAEYKRKIEEKNKQLDAQFNIVKKIEEEVAPLVMPYDNLPDAAARADVCYRAIAYMMQPVAGWAQTSVKCDEEYVTAQMRRGHGTLGGFYDTADKLMPGAFVTEISPDVISVQVALPRVAVRAGRDARDANTIMRALHTAFQGIDTSATIDSVVDTITNGVSTAKLNIIEVGASSKLTPGEFIKIFSDFDGVHITRVEWTAANRTWNYEVIIYANEDNF